VSPASYVVALRALGLGDLLTGVPALRGVRRAWPGAELALAAPEPGGRFLQELGVVDTVLPLSGLDEPVPAGGRPAPDVAVNLHGRGPQSHRLLEELAPRRLVGFASDQAGFSDGPAWDEGEHEVDRWCRLVAGTGGACTREDLRLDLPGAGRGPGDVVVVHPGAASGSRRWPVGRWQAVVRALVGRGHGVVVTGVAAERHLCALVAGATPGAEDWCGRLDLRGLAERVASARLLLCGDTGVAHVATAVGTPSVLLFGPTDPARWGPALDPQLHHVLWHPRNGDPVGDPHGAPIDVRLARTGVDEVLCAAERLLGSRTTADDGPGADGWSHGDDGPGADG
jgi:ADP-heptose:LPS heptosyltransferase